MVTTYNIAGRQVGSHVLAMATLGTFGAIGAWAMAGKQKAKQDGPPINATSKDEEKFIQEFIDKANKEGQPAKH
ncbi:MAG: ATP synthase subunit mitochondrial [Lasallia pustulata]|uniref:ATP synthase subunit mitochondrial n=1 Tax=Lasallia pustulata TaxID=136370 RepID=A0A1W5DD48_9LECA|nr:MAG: ATP synthase subunit mitochondrial [Lasallia pustulata]SLM40779.1 Protein of unknown function DUF2611 [Lasallia pustulata]